MHANSTDKYSRRTRTGIVFGGAMACWAVLGAIGYAIVHL